MISTKQKLYLNNRLCNGNGHTLNEYTKADLVRIASEQKPRIPIPKGSKKEEICNLLIKNKVQFKDITLPKPNRFLSIEEVMTQLDVQDARNLIHMSEDEVEEIISRMKVYDGKMTMTDFLKGKSGSERAKAFLIVLSEKYCRCLKSIEQQKSSYSPNAICTKSIFNSKGLKGPGSNYQCTPVPLILPSKNNKYLLEKK
jgi:hypothetical protein